LQQQLIQLSKKLPNFLRKPSTPFSIRLVWLTSKQLAEMTEKVTAKASCQE